MRPQVTDGTGLCLPWLYSSFLTALPPLPFTTGGDEDEDEAFSDFEEGSEEDEEDEDEGGKKGSGARPAATSTPGQGRYKEVSRTSPSACLLVSPLRRSQNALCPLLNQDATLEPQVKALLERCSIVNSAQAGGLSIEGGPRFHAGLAVLASQGGEQQ